MEFEEFIKKNMTIFKAFASKYSMNNLDEAEDLLQDAFVKAFSAYDKVNKNKEDSNLVSWMISIIKNCAIDKSRSNKEKMKTRSHSIDEIVDGRHSLEETLEQHSFKDVETELESNQIIDDIKNMDEFNSNVFIMKMEGYSNKEIMEILNKSESAVKNSIFKVRNKLVPNRKKIR